MTATQGNTPDNQGFLNPAPGVPSLTFNHYEIIRCNQACALLFGATQVQQLIGRHAADLSPEYQLDGIDSITQIQHYATLCFQSGSISFEWLFRTLSGVFLLCDVHFSMGADSNEIYAVFENPRLYLQPDITSSASESQKSDVFRENFNLLNEHKRAIDASAIVSKTDRYGVITYVNDMFCDVSGYKRVELVGKNHNVVNHPNMPKEVFADLWKTIRSGKVWSGIIKNRKKDGGSYYVSSTITPIVDTKGDVREYIAIRFDISDLYEKEQIIFNQRTDPETGLPNRISFNDDLSKKINCWIAVLQVQEIVDLQKIYNTYEYHKIIKGISSLMIDKMSGFSTLYRISESCFAAVCHCQCDLDSFYAECLSAIKSIVANCVSLEGTQIYFTISSGIAKNEHPEKTLSQAFIALDSVSSSHKSIGLYRAGNEEYKRLNEGVYWAARLRRALLDDSIDIFGQGIFDINAKKYSTEILMRHRSEETFTSPYFFLNHAKSAGLYSSLTEVVLKKSFVFFKQCKSRFSINIDYDDVYNEKTRRLIFNLIDKYNLGSHVTIEFLECSGIDFSNDIVVGFIRDLKAVGCNIAIDDFGSGYSNFEYLTRIEVDLVKVDGSLVKDIDSNHKHHEVVRHIVSLCHALGIKVVAEFVANESIFKCLKAMKVDYYQGYFFEKPYAL